MKADGEVGDSPLLRNHDDCPRPGTLFDNVFFTFLPLVRLDPDTRRLPLYTLALFRMSCRTLHDVAKMPIDLREARLQLYLGLVTWISIRFSVQHTFQGLFNSKPAGASGLSICPLKVPVSRRSRSITANKVSIDVESHQYISWNHTLLRNC